MPYDLVVVGTSLGGLSALRTLLAYLPVDFPAAVAVVQHRGKDPDEELCTYLQQFCQLPLMEANDKQMIEPGHIYIAPPNYHLMVEANGIFALSTDAPVISARPSIDVLFESAARIYHKRLIGVILTGASKDGARGASRIHERGGVVFVQEPASAESKVMPKAAIASIELAGFVDSILPLEELGHQLVLLVMAGRSTVKSLASPD